MKTLPRFLCAVSLAAATACCARVADARDAVIAEEKALAALRRHLDDDRAFLDAAVRVVTSDGEDPAVREAALRSAVRVAAETGDWFDVERLCRSFLASPRSPERLLPVCADGLARALRMLVGYWHATEELEEFARALTERARPAVATALDVMRRPVRSELDSRVAHRLPAPLVTRPSELTAEVASKFPGAVETSVELTAEVASRFPGAVETSVELTAEVASRFPGAVETSVELTAEVASRFPGAVETSVELTAEVASRFPGAVETSVKLTAEVASRFPGAVETSVELTAEVASRFPGPVGTSVDKSRADRMLGWAEQTLSANLLQEARALEEGKDLAGARDRYAEHLSLLRSGGETSAGIEGLWRTFAAGPDAPAPVQTTVEALFLDDGFSIWPSSAQWTLPTAGTVQTVGTPGDTSITIQAIKPTADPENPGAGDKLEYEMTLNGPSLDGTPVFVHCGDKTDVVVLGAWLDFTEPEKVCVGNEATFTVNFRPHSSDVDLSVDSCDPAGYVTLDDATRDNTAGTITGTVEGPPADELPDDDKVSFTLKAANEVDAVTCEYTKPGATPVSTITDIEMETDDGVVTAENNTTLLCFDQVDGFWIAVYGICCGERYTEDTLGLPIVRFEHDEGGTNVDFVIDDDHGHAHLEVPDGEEPVCGDITVTAYMDQTENTDFIDAETARLETVELTIQVRKIDELELTADKTTAVLSDTVTFTATGFCKDGYVGEDPDPAPWPGDFLQGVTYSIVSGGHLGSLAANVLTITSPLPGTIQVQATWTCPNNAAISVDSNVVDVVVAVGVDADLDVDSDNNNRNGAPDRNDAEDEAEEEDGKFILVNVDDDDSNGTLDYTDQVINGNSDRDHDMAVMVAEVSVVHDALSYYLAATDYTPIRVFTHDGDYLIGPDAGHNSEQELTSDMFTGTQLTMHVEGVETGDTTISLIVRDNGNELGSDAALITVTDSLETAPLSVPHLEQHKDTEMLCVADCPVHGPGDHEWDKDHERYRRQCAHCALYCARAGAAMICRYYGGSASQDRVSYFCFAGTANANGGDLGHGQAVMAPRPLAWVLGLDTSGNGKNDLEAREHAPAPGNNDDWKFIGNAVLSYRPLYVSWRPDGFYHGSVIAGARVTAAGARQVRLLDPMTNAPAWRPLGDIRLRYLYTPAENKVASINGRHDEASVSAHSDDDGVVDFDEDNRFSADLGYALDKTNPDSNGVPPDDKEEIRVRYGVR